MASTEVAQLLSYLLTYSMEQCPSWEANRFSASKEIPSILWNPKVHYCIHMWPTPPIPILSQINPVHVPTFHLLKIHHNIILRSMPGSSKWPLSFRFPHQNPVHGSSLPHPSYMSRPSHYSRFNHPNSIGSLSPRPQIADRGTPSNMEGSYKYIE
jgi:hypothetical protein